MPRRFSMYSRGSDRQWLPNVLWTGSCLAACKQDLWCQTMVAKCVVDRQLPDLLQARCLLCSEGADGIDAKHSANEVCPTRG